MRQSDERPVAMKRDPQGRVVVVPERIWFGKIAVEHPELLRHLEAAVRTIHHPDRVIRDANPRRLQYFLRGVGPSKWLKVVVSYEQKPARVITVYAMRKVGFENEG